MAESDVGIGSISANELQRRAVAGSAWTAIHVAIGIPIAFAANAIVARSLGVSDYGRLALLTTSLLLMFSLANFGFAAALVQVGSRAEASGRRTEADDLLRRSLGFHMIVELPILVVVAVALTRAEPLWEAVFVITGVTLACVLSGAAFSLTIENRTAAAARVAIGVNLVLQAAAVTAAALTKSPSAVWAVRTVVPAVALVASFALLDARRRKAVLQLRLPRGLGKPFWRFALFSWGSGFVAALVVSRSEIFLLQAFDRVEALGLFALAFGLSQQITAPADAMLHALLPATAGVLAAYPERAPKAFERSTRVSALICGAIAAALVPAFVLAVPLIYGDSFRRAAWLFVPLAVISILQSVNNPVIAFANARQRGGLLLAAFGAALTVDVAVALMLIPPFGAWGGVAANVSGQVVGLVWLASAEPLVRAAGSRMLFRLYAPFLIGLAIGGGAIALAHAIRPASGILGLPAVCGAAAVIYVLGVRSSGLGLTMDDHDALMGAVATAARPVLSRLLKPVVTPS